MRELSLDELSYVCGAGYDASYGYQEDPNPEIVVVATLPEKVYFGGFLGVSGFFSAGDSNTPSPPPSEAEIWAGSMVESAPTPCVTAVPVGTELQVINDHAKGVEAWIKESQNDVNVELGTIFYRVPGRPTEVFKTALHTSNKVDQTVIRLSDVPSGATIVGFMHTHPRKSGLDQSYPSDNYVANGTQYEGNDVIAYNSLQNLKSTRISVAPNILFYIYDRDTQKTYVYDKNNVARHRRSCAL